MCALVRSRVGTGLHLLLTALMFGAGTGAVWAQGAARQSSVQRRMSSEDLAALHGALDAYDGGRAEQAEPVLRELAKRYPGSYEANEALGSLYAEGDEPVRALPYLEQACRVAPKEALAEANLGAAYLKLGKTAEAVRALERAVALDGQNGRTQSNLGEALMVAGQPTAAGKAFSAAARLLPGDAQVRYNWALALFGSGSAQEAADVIEQVPAEAMTDQIHSLAGDAEEHAGHFERALVHFQAAAKMNPSDANLVALTDELLRHWTWPEAIEIANYGSKLYPASTHFRMDAGIAYYGKSDYKEAVRVFSGLLEEDPNNAVVADLLGRSCTQLTEGEGTGCGGMYEFAQRHPGNAVTTTYAAVAILHEPKEKQDLGKAEDLLKAAMAADPKYAEAYYEMGVLQQSRLEWAESAASLERSIALRPDSPEAHYRLSRAYTHMGRREDAQAQIALHQSYSEQAKAHLDTKMQEVVRFVLKPS